MTFNKRLSRSTEDCQRGKYIFSTQIYILLIDCANNLNYFYRNRENNTEKTFGPTSGGITRNEIKDNLSGNNFGQD